MAVTFVCIRKIITCYCHDCECISHRSGHFEKRPLADKLPRNEKSTLTFFYRSDGILDNHEEKLSASLTSYGTTPRQWIKWKPISEYTKFKCLTLRLKP